MNRQSRRIQAARARQIQGVATRVSSLPVMHDQVKKRIRLVVVKAYDSLDRAAAKMRETVEVSCKSGCFACCRMPVDATVEEALVILDKYPDAVREARTEIEAQSERLDKMCDLFDDWTEHQAEIADLWWNENRFCAFLRDGLCSVYEARPLTCRNYHVMTDPELCGGPAGTPVTVVMPVSRDLLYPVLARAMPHHDISMGYLPTVVKAALLMDEKK